MDKNHEFPITLKIKTLLTSNWNLLDLVLLKAACQPEAHISIKRADQDQLKEIFLKYASIEKDGVPYMTFEDFVRKFVGLCTEAEFNAGTVKLLGSILDTRKSGLISFEEFCGLEATLCKPDALYRVAFQLFDRSGTGYITCDDFENVIRHTTLHKKIPFNFDSDFMKLHFGEDRSHTVTYTEFTQTLHDFHEEHAIQAFKCLDKRKQGHISAQDFTHIMTEVKTHLLTEEVKQNLTAVAREAPGHRVTFPYFMAFNSLLNNMELVKKVYLNFTRGDTLYELTKEEFIHAAQQISQMTPMEVEILFELVGFLRPHSGRINFEDLERISPIHQSRAFSQPFAELKAVDSPSERGIGIQILESAYRFTLGSFAGATGATIVYPIDLVKTRMQNQRSGSYIGELMYKNSWDCFAKVLRHEGPLGLYRGLLPQLLGVCPEKAIKLTVNDFVRDRFFQSMGHIPLWGEIFAGCCAGASQVMFTNPLEIVKIRLQVAGEIARAGTKVRAWQVMKDLGPRGLYKGARACFLRDIPFSGIYFPVYANMKRKLADADGHNNPGSLLLAACIAGVPAAYLVTPADVIKTRLQVQAREGQTTYAGVTDAVRKIWKEEGGHAFWKGGPARVFRSSPQFGFTLLTYEILQRLFYVDFGGSHPSGSQAPHHPISPPSSGVFKVPHNPDQIGGYSQVLATLAAIESKFGLVLPKAEVDHHIP